MRKLFFIILFIPFSAFSAIVATSSMEEAFDSCMSNVAASGYGSTGIGIFTCGLNDSDLFTWYHIDSDAFTTNKTKWSFPECPAGQAPNEGFLKCSFFQCSEIPYTPSNFGVIYGGFCVDDGSGNPVSHEATSCYIGEASYPVPRCTLVQCPDSSYIDTSLGESCPLPRMCPDGAIVYGDAECPPLEFICPDGKRVSNISFCPDPTQDLKQCWDLSLIPVSASCPPSPDVICHDGSTASSILSCPPLTVPDPNPKSFKCSNGSSVQDISDCPAPVVTPSDVKDTSVSTTTFTSTTIINEGTGVRTTTGTGTTSIKINLDGLNSRLDTINKSLGDVNDTLVDVGKDNAGNRSSIYAKSGKTMSGAHSAFMSAMSTSNIVTQVDSIFVLSGGASSCPTWTLPSVMSMPSFLIDHHCQPFMNSVFFAISAVLIMLSTLMAIKISLVG